LQIEKNVGHRYRHHISPPGMLKILWSYVYNTVRTEKNIKMFLSYLPQNPVDSDKI